MPAGTDEPYGPVVRSVGPALDALPDDDLDAVLGPAAADLARIMPQRRGPPGGRPGGRRLARHEGAPERRQARALEGVLGMLGRLGERRPDRARARGPAPRRRRDAGAGHVPRPDRVGPAARAHRLGPAGHRAPRRPVDRAPSRRSRPRRGRSSGWPCRVLDRDELAALIEGIEGERASASLLLLVAERSGGSPLVAEELLAARRELPTASLTGSLDELVMSRLAVRSLECRRVLRLLAPAGRPLDAGAPRRGRGRLRGRDGPPGPALGERPAPRGRRPRRGPDGGPGGGHRARVPRRARRRRSDSATS